MAEGGLCKAPSERESRTGPDSTAQHRFEDQALDVLVWFGV